MQKKIQKNAAALYKHKQINGDSTSLARRCNDFALLEDKCRSYKRK
ncbi:type III toxin-antitoxin system ToxN/AbiQ family toxin [Hominenteromicrobium sp.]